MQSLGTTQKLLNPPVQQDSQAIATAGSHQRFTALPHIDDNAQHAGAAASDLPEVMA
jgi:hypothetical protein